MGAAEITAVIAVLVAVGTLVREWIKDRGATPVQRLSTEQSLRREVEDLWRQLHAAQRRIYSLEQFLAEKGYDPREVNGGDPSLIEGGT